MGIVFEICATRLIFDICVTYTHTYFYTHTHTYIYTYTLFIYIYIYTPASIPYLGEQHPPRHLVQDGLPCLHQQGVATHACYYVGWVFRVVGVLEEEGSLHMFMIEHNNSDTNTDILYINPQALIYIVISTYTHTHPPHAPRPARPRRTTRGGRPAPELVYLCMCAWFSVMCVCQK